MLAPVEIPYKPAASKIQLCKSKIIPGWRQLCYENNNKCITIITYSSYNHGVVKGPVSTLRIAAPGFISSYILSSKPVKTNGLKK